MTTTISPFFPMQVMPNSKALGIHKIAKLMCNMYPYMQSKCGT